MSLRSGSSLGPYEILDAIGAGGMGEVYRARDTRLGRDVAIKVLPKRVAGDADSLARFEREARAIAALSHPNILAIHDFGTGDGGTAYAVMELLDGQTLGAALESGPLPPRKAIEIARQVARGLGSAHDNGVVHRDLKPDNLFLSPDGRVKILDFGLARVGGASSPDSSTDDPTRTHLTNPGSVMGTINYMSPEQARGLPAGPASDIFALGSVLLEMLTGQRPFERETAPETMTAILREDPPEITREGVAPSVVSIVQRCLEKEPEQRFQSAHDLAFALQTSSQSSGSGAVPITIEPTARSGRRPSLLALVAMLALGIVVGASGKALLFPPAATPPVKIRPITFSGFAADPTVSPDGLTVAFASRGDGTSGIRIQELRGGNDVALTRGQDRNPRFSPDGTALLFVRFEGAAASIYRVPRLGGEPRKLIDDAVEADWSPTGSRIAFVRSTYSQTVSIGIANADGSGERIVVEGPAGERWRSPRWSPDGSTVAFVSTFANNNVPLRVVLLDVKTGELRDLPPRRPSVSGLVWSGSGRELLFGWSDDLLSGQASTESRVVLQDVRDGTERDLFWTRDMMQMQNGSLLDIVAPGVVAFATISSIQNLTQVVFDDSGASTFRTLTVGNSVDRQPKLAPDGESVLFASNRAGSLDLWTLDLESGEARQLTDDVARDWDPGYTADGREILWSSDRSGNLEIWMANADGSGARQVTSDGVDAENPTATPDGEWIVYMTSNPDHPGLWKIRRDGSEATLLWSGSGFVPDLSPDGRFAAFVTSNRRTNVIRVVAIETGELLPFQIDVPLAGTTPVGAEGRPRWVSDGRAIAFNGPVGDRIGVYVQDFAREGDTSGSRRALTGFGAERNTESFDIAPDGDELILSQARQIYTVMLAEGVPFVTPPTNR